MSICGHLDSMLNITSNRQTNKDCEIKRNCVCLILVVGKTRIRNSQKNFWRFFLKILESPFSVIWVFPFRCLSETLLQEQKTLKKKNTNINLENRNNIVTVVYCGVFGEILAVDQKKFLHQQHSWRDQSKPVMFRAESFVFRNGCRGNHFCSELSQHYSEFIIVFLRERVEHLKKDV